MTMPCTLKRPLALAAGLVARGFRLRAETGEDVPFLERLYLSVRWEELAQVLWPDEAKAAFLKSQFEMQYRHYATHYAEADFGILEQDGVPAGRLYLFRGRKELRIVDVSLLPEWRGGGVGTALLQAVFDEATTDGKSVSIHVEKFNPALRLYRRLGFQEAEDKGVYWLMQWKPGAIAA